MNIERRIREDNEFISYLNESFRMIYYNEQNGKKTFWWWLNKFEYIAYLTEVPDDKMAELFLEMVHENIHEGIKKKYPAINFTELSYEEIISHYICYFDYSGEILSQRKPFKHRNNYERIAIKKYANIFQDMYNNTIYRYRLENLTAKQYCDRYNDLQLTKYLKESPTQSLRFAEAFTFAKAIELARYVTPALSMIKIYNLKNTGKFHEWLNKFEDIANISKVPDDRMLEFFNNMIDNDVHSAVKMAYPFISLSRLSYEEIINYYLQYFVSCDDRDLHKIRLLCRKQYKHETIINYADSLRKLSEKCIYPNRLDGLLVEQFLNGIYDNEIGTIIKKFSRLTFVEMVRLAIELTKFKNITYYLKPDFLMINTYDPVNEGIFYEWLNKFEYVADVIGVHGDKLVEFFKNMVHKDVHARVQECNPGVNFSELGYEAIVNYYLCYLCSYTAVYLHRKRFISRKQYEHETLEHFANSLCQIQYYFNRRHHSNVRLRDQFRIGIRDENIRIYINKYRDLSFELTVAIAISYSNELSFMETN